MDAATIVSIITQLGLAGAAWRLANSALELAKALRERVDDHEGRIDALEKRGA